MDPRCAVTLIVALIITGCGGATASPAPATTAPAPTAIASATAASGAAPGATQPPARPALDRFPAGIYFLTPNLDRPSGYLTLLGGELPVRIDLILFDPAARAPAGGTFEPGVDQTAFSKDGRLILSGHSLSVYDVATGAKIADLKAAALRGLAAAGYELDTRFPGQGGQGTFPLDGDFSPDGKTIVFDGAVRQGAVYGMLLCSIGLDGSNFRVLAGPFPVEPRFTNNLNWSSLNPTWLGP